MRKEIAMRTLRDFGVRSRGAAFKAAAESRQPEGFYDELIAEFSRNVRSLLRDMMRNITAGNTIYPVNETEIQERRRYQAAAIFYLNTLDHFIKENLRIKYYGRYMDDLYLIHAGKEYLKRCLSEIKTVCQSLKIAVNGKRPGS